MDHSRPGRPPPSTETVPMSRPPPNVMLCLFTCAMSQALSNTVDSVSRCSLVPRWNLSCFTGTLDRAKGPEFARTLGRVLSHQQCCGLQRRPDHPTIPLEQRTLR